MNICNFRYQLIIELSKIGEVVIIVILKKNLRKNFLAM